MRKIITHIELLPVIGGTRKCVECFGEEVEEKDNRDNLYVALAALSSLNLYKDLILKILEVSKMENSPFFDGIREEWEARGKAEEKLRERLREELKDNWKYFWSCWKPNLARYRAN